MSAIICTVVFATINEYKKSILKNDLWKETYKYLQYQKVKIEAFGNQNYGVTTFIHFGI